MATLSDFFPTDDFDDVLDDWIRNLISSSLRSEYKNSENLSATRTLLDMDTPLQRLNCNGANRIVKMPTADTEDNHHYLIFNGTSSGTYTLTVQNNGGTVTYCILAPYESVLMLPDGNGGYEFIPSKRETAYKITPTVTSNDLKVAITHADGTTPSATRPLWFYINGTWRAQVAELNVQLNDGTNWMNLGAAAHATFENNIFVYIVWVSANSAVGVIISRIPYATLYDGTGSTGFSSTTTSEKYGACARGNNTSTTPSSTDGVVNIGRFAATLSAGAGYTWTVPTFTNSNLIQRPIYEGDFCTWQPSPTGFSAVPTNTIYQFRFVNKSVEVVYREGTAGASNATTMTATVPFTPKTLTNYIVLSPCAADDNSVTLTTPARALFQSGTTTITFQKDMGAGTWTAALNKRISYLRAMYEVG